MFAPPSENQLPYIAVSFPILKPGPNFPIFQHSIIPIRAKPLLDLLDK